jgi:hypothetical protein
LAGLLYGRPQVHDSTARLLDHLIGAGEHGCRHLNAERLWCYGVLLSPFRGKLNQLETILGLYMRNLLRSVMVWAVCVMGMALLSPLAAQVNQQAVAGSVNIYNLDRDARTGGIEIHGRIGKAVANEAVKLLSSIRPDVDELTVFLSSPGGDVFAAMELGEEIRRQWALTSVDDDGECFGACVLVLAAGVRRTPASENVGLQRMSFAQKDVAKKVEAYLSRMGMPKKLFQEIAAQQSSNKLRLLDSGRLKALGLEGIDPAYEQWLRANENQERSQPN